MGVCRTINLGWLLQSDIKPFFSFFKNHPLESAIVAFGQTENALVVWIAAQLAAEGNTKWPSTSFKAQDKNETP